MANNSPAWLSGKEAAFGIVDYIGAIPATFSDDDNRDWWRGYMFGEYERFCDGKRDETAYWNAQERLCAALNKYACDKARPARIARQNARRAARLASAAMGKRA